MSVVFFHGDRGGTGKSTLGIIHIEYLISRGHRPLIIDGDPRNPDLFRLFGAAENRHSGALQVDLRDPAGPAELLSLLSEHETNDVAISLPAGIGWEIEAMQGLLTAGLAEINRSLVFYWVLGPSVDSINLLRPLLAAYPSATTVAVKNLFFGDHFAIWERSQTRREFLAGGGREIILEKLFQPVIAATIAAHPPVRFSDAGKVLRYGERQVLKQWLERSFRTLDAIAERIQIGKP